MIEEEKIEEGREGIAPYLCMCRKRKEHEEK